MKLYTAKAVAEILGITDRQVRNLRDEGVLSEARPGLFSLKTVLRQYLDFKLGGRDDQANLIAKKAEREAVKAEIERMRLEEARRNLIPAEDVERAMSAMLSNFRTRLLEIPMKHAATMAQVKDQGEAFDILNRAITEALEEISEFDVAMAAPKEGENDEQEE